MFRDFHGCILLFDASSCISEDYARQFFRNVFGGDVAYEEVTVDRLKAIHAIIAEASDELKKVYEDMEKTGPSTAMLQVVSLENFATGCRSLSVDAGMDVKNQRECAISGALPTWRKNTDRAKTNRIRDLKKTAERALVPLGLATPGEFRSATLDQVVTFLELKLAKKQNQSIVDAILEIRESGLLQEDTPAAAAARNLVELEEAGAIKKPAAVGKKVKKVPGNK